MPQAAAVIRASSSSRGTGRDCHTVMQTYTQADDADLHETHMMVCLHALGGQLLAADSSCNSQGLVQFA
jgi:hypothetical protein